jgi:hypothetical protein
MGLYTSYDNSMYYDKKAPTQVPKQKSTEAKVQQIKPTMKKSLYDQAQKVATKKELYKGVDFRTKYRVGQHVAIQGPNGIYRTQQGIIAEIVAENLMYVYMEDTYKDSTDQWLADFVTDKDTIHEL